MEDERRKAPRRSMALPRGRGCSIVRTDRRLSRWEYGAANRTRTCDPVITNDVLYQLSYCGGPNAALGVSRKRPHLISGTAPIGKKKGISCRPSVTKIPASRRPGPWAGRFV